MVTFSYCPAQAQVHDLVDLGLVEFWSSPSPRPAQSGLSGATFSARYSTTRWWGPPPGRHRPKTESGGDVAVVVVHKGMAADLAVLDRDLFAPDTDVAGTCSVLTPVAGEAVHTE
ncbi:hypothetical protein ACIQFZ_39725 [Streptomyces sp. NPDC093064]|uniref:hypothetical protein n=1 Tax=Streptomyces sp. NPDC093064 TaxID=3366020 RepID=UPI003827BA76